MGNLPDLFSLAKQLMGSGALDELGPVVEQLAERTAGYHPAFMFGFTETALERFELQHRELSGSIEEAISAFAKLPMVPDAGRADEMIDGLAAYARDVERLCDHARSKLAPGEAARTPAGDEQVPRALATSTVDTPPTEPAPGGADLLRTPDPTCTATAEIREAYGCLRRFGSCVGCPCFPDPVVPGEVVP